MPTSSPEQYPPHPRAPLGERDPNGVANTPNSGKKRKFDAVSSDDAKSIMFPEHVEPISDDDARVKEMVPESCAKIRGKIRNWIDSGAQTVGEFQKEICATRATYSNFMRKRGEWEGESSGVYYGAMHFFRKRELQGLPLAVPKENQTKKPAQHSSGKSVAELLETGDVVLPGESTGEVPVYDSCAEVRRKMRALLKKGVSQAAFARTLSKMLPSGGGQVSPRNLQTFLKQKHLMDGNTSPTFYAGYVFFEKQRIKNQKPKTKTRQGMEEAHGQGGVNRRHNFKGGYVTVMPNEMAYMDNYGRMQFIKA